MERRKVICDNDCMTTPSNPLKSLDPTEHVYVVDSVGVLARPTVSYVLRALARGEVVPTDRADVLRLVPRPIRQLTPAEKRALELRKAKR